MSKRKKKKIYITIYNATKNLKYKQKRGLRFKTYISSLVYNRALKHTAGYCTGAPTSVATYNDIVPDSFYPHPSTSNFECFRYILRCVKAYFKHGTHLYQELSQSMRHRNTGFVTPREENGSKVYVSTYIDLERINHLTDYIGSCAVSVRTPLPPEEDDLHNPSTSVTCSHPVLILWCLW